MNNEIPPRRVVMRAALAVGCSLWMPIALAADANGKKVPQASARYQAKPNGEQKCGICANYIAVSNTCKLVESPISSQGWCSQWAKIS